MSWWPMEVADVGVDPRKFQQKSTSALESVK